MADVVLLAYVLSHVSDPGRAVALGARIAVGRVRGVGRAADRRRGSVPPPRKVDAGLDTPEAIRRLLGASGLEPERVWRQELHRQCTLDTYWPLLNGSGLSRLRLEGLDAEAREAAVARAHQSLAGLDPSGFEWSGEVVCAVAVRPDPMGGS